MTPNKCFLVKFAKFVRKPFPTEHLWWLLLHLPWLLLYFKKKKTTKQLFHNLARRTDIIFFSTHRSMYTKSNPFVYKFLANCQLF